MAKKRRKTFKKKVTENNNEKIVNEKSAEEKGQEVANELCDRMLHKENNEKDTEENIKDDKVENNEKDTEEKDEEVQKKEEVKTENNILDITEESYDVPKEEKKYVPEEMSEMEVFSGVVELVNKIYSSSEITKDDFNMASEVYDGAKEIYTDATFKFSEGIKIALCKGLEFLDKNKISIASIIGIVREILSMEKAMLKCKVDIDKDEGIKVDVNVEEGKETTTDSRTEKIEADNENKEVKTFDQINNPSLRLLRFICGINK